MGSQGTFLLIIYSFQTTRIKNSSFLAASFDQGEPGCCSRQNSTAKHAVRTRKEGSGAGWPEVQSFLGTPAVKTPLLTQRVQVRSLVRELRSHVSRGKSYVGKSYKKSPSVHKSTHSLHTSGAVGCVHPRESGQDPRSSINSEMIFSIFQIRKLQSV